jgi:hypothetical protein
LFTVTEGKANVAVGEIVKVVVVVGVNVMVEVVASVGDTRVGGVGVCGAVAGTTDVSSAGGVRLSRAVQAGRRNRLTARR